MHSSSIYLVWINQVCFENVVVYVKVVFGTQIVDDCDQNFKVNLYTCCNRR